MSGDFAHYDLGNLRPGAIVEITLGSRANVTLLDSANLQRYRSGQGYNGYGGEQVRSPARLDVPHAGHWHVVIDLGGYAGTIESSVSVLSAAV